MQHAFLLGGVMNFGNINGQQPYMRTLPPH